MDGWPHEWCRPRRRGSRCWQLLEVSVQTGEELWQCCLSKEDCIQGNIIVLKIMFIPWWLGFRNETLETHLIGIIWNKTFIIYSYPDYQVCMSNSLNLACFTWCCKVGFMMLYNHPEAIWHVSQSSRGNLTLSISTKNFYFKTVFLLFKKWNDYGFYHQFNIFYEHKHHRSSLKWRSSRRTCLSSKPCSTLVSAIAIGPKSLRLSATTFAQMILTASVSS